MSSSASLIKNKRMLATNSSEYDDIVKSDSLRVYIDGYSYIATKNRSASLKNGITEVTREDGMTYCDHVYREPMSMSYTIIVSKLNGIEYNKLKSIYTNRKLVEIKSLSYYCPYAIMSSFKVTDEMFDTLQIDVSFNEVLVSGNNNTSDISSTFQLGGDSTINTVSASTNIYQDVATVNELVNAIEDTSDQTALMSITRDNVVDQYYTFSGNTVLAGNDKTVSTQTDDSDSVRTYETRRIENFSISL